MQPAVALVDGGDRCWVHQRRGRVHPRADGLDCDRRLTSPGDVPPAIFEWQFTKR
jgi:hypothetical protein